MSNENAGHTTGLIGDIAASSFIKMFEAIRRTLLVDKCERLASVWYSNIHGQSIADELKVFIYLKSLDQDVNPYEYFSVVHQEHPEFFSLNGLKIDGDSVHISFGGELLLDPCEFYYDMGEFAAALQLALLRNAPPGGGIGLHLIKKNLLTK